MSASASARAHFTEGRTVYRVQDGTGRGPYRPGFSKQWTDKRFAHGMTPLPSWTEEFGPEVVARVVCGSGHFGCAVHSISDLGKWFSKGERKRLRRLGFYVAELSSVRVIAESQHQLVIQSDRPLREVARLLDWAEIEKALEAAKE